MTFFENHHQPAYATIPVMYSDCIPSWLVNQMPCQQYQKYVGQTEMEN
jgi:hypothetical protein